MLYIFDMENVSGKAFEGVENLENTDKLIVFYSQNSKNISWDTHLQILESNATKEYIKVKVGGKNALDFQLATFVGYKFGENPNESITIISGDTGFEHVVNFWKSKGQQISRTNTVFVEKQDEKADDIKNIETQNIEPQTVETQNVEPQIVEIKAPSNQNNQKLTKNEINTILCKKVSTQTTGEIYKLIDKYKTKQGINNALCKKMGSQDGGEVYKIIKPLIANKKGK